jgi:hypothetical protein
MAESIRRAQLDAPSADNPITPGMVKRRPDREAPTRPKNGKRHGGSLRIGRCASSGALGQPMPPGRKKPMHCREFFDR